MFYIVVTFKNLHNITHTTLILAMIGSIMYHFSAAILLPLHETSSLIVVDYKTWLYNIDFN